MTVTDLDPIEVAGRGWAETSQHTGSLDHVYDPMLVDRATFDRRVSLRYVDMNAIPPDLTDYDFCWSICSLEHLGSIAHGLDFVENSLKTLKPGGYAIHTTEFNFLETDQTIDNWPTVLFLRKHFEELAARLQRSGHWVAPLDFNLGEGVLDRFVDLPPFEPTPDEDKTGGWITRVNWRQTDGVAHIKAAIDGFASTCYGLVIQKAS